MSNDELLARIDWSIYMAPTSLADALRALMELHKTEYWENIHDPNWNGNECSVCFTDGNLEIPSARIDYPCPTIQAIEKELGC